MTIYIVLSSNKNEVIKFENVISLNKHEGGLLTFWTLIDRTPVYHEYNNVISLESN